MKKSISPVFYIIGGGRVGAGLAHLFIQHNFNVNYLVENSTERCDYLRHRMKWDFVSLVHSIEKIEKSDIVIIAVQDDRISDVVEHLTEMNIKLKNKIVVHCSGIHSSDLLRSLKMLGANCVSLHPIYSFSSDPMENDGLDKIFFDAEGDKEALDVFKILINDFSNKIFVVDAEEKIALHLACVFYSNFIVALFSSSRKIMKNILSLDEGISKMFYPLLIATISHVMKSGIQGGLTGPIKRGDEKTIKMHLNFLKDKYPELINTYTQLSQELVSVSGLNDDRKKGLMDVLNSDFYKN